ncbi:tonB-system energizer ExbB [Novosphingobium mangrovi (ex Huang et al. 2023)]|uniref:Biopolymer transport protein ExbB n=1 Tax=Novosphingobium mangrovi (ex Huang et al. 2023) TaxID=2976432 RepID=A0ABT2HZG1_9SPHN|nr:tonB-system energizer ExbB [Novosphingobium mangrovi (ex Huang et al. 2023)]MCT2397943.1 tonB-system energizer ExbB [Novosphingobium mangrovi (ex Huang et al. 2023)]
MNEGIGDTGLSPWGMFLGADPIVQIVMGALVFASLVTWTILFAKGFAMRREVKRLRDSVGMLRTAPRLQSVPEELPSQAVRNLVADARDELAASVKADILDQAEARVAVGLERIVAANSRQVGFGVGTVATIGSTAPFVGLFGTVWGIMNSFVGIAKTHTTNLAVVAPGIAEALLATACGLVAAIPAVIIYNHLTRDVGRYKAMVGDASAMVIRLTSRELELLARERRPGAPNGSGEAGLITGGDADRVPAFQD